MAPRPDAASVALYVHDAASGQVSGMAWRPLAMLATAGFAIVFITRAETVPEADWQAARQHRVLVAQRRNFGRDRGAWWELAAEAWRALVPRGAPCPVPVIEANLYTMNAPAEENETAAARGAGQESRHPA